MIYFCAIFEHELNVYGFVCNNNRYGFVCSDSRRGVGLLLQELKSKNIKHVPTSFYTSTKMFIIVSNQILPPPYVLIVT